MPIRDVFATNLRRLRNERGLSQEKLADEAEIDRTYVSLLERAKYAASIDMIEKLASALAVEPAEFLKPVTRPSTKAEQS